VALVCATAVNREGQREVLGMDEWAGAVPVPALGALTCQLAGGAGCVDP
jgi:hypothetical protein